MIMITKQQITNEINEFGVKLGTFKLLLELGCARDDIFANFIPRRTYYDCLGKLNEQSRMMFKKFVKETHNAMKKSNNSNKRE